MKILVTGGSGYLGLHVRRFFDADDFSRRSSLDILSTIDVSRLTTYDAVIHLAAHLDKDPEAAELCYRTNAEGTANLLRQMPPNSVFIYASTKDVYGAHAENYEAVPETCATEYCGQTALEWSKLMGEQYVEYYARQRNLRACIFRYGRVPLLQSIQVPAHSCYVRRHSLFDICRDIVSKNRKFLPKSIKRAKGSIE